MGVKKAFILAAGYGTRMGEVGESLPKILWPVFDKTLLELQICYLGEVGVEKIFINIHHQALKIASFVEKKNLDVEILYEKQLLGSGGCFHNFKKRVGDDKILAVNGDVFYFHPDLEGWYDVEGTTLYGIKTEGGYGQIVVEDGMLRDVRKTVGKPPYTMFTGVSVVDLHNVVYTAGRSGYFSTVADFRHSDIHVRESAGGTYRDFGTLDRYIGNLMAIVAGQRNVFVDFLVRHGALDRQLLNEEALSYRSDCSGELHFGGGFKIVDGNISL